MKQDFSSEELQRLINACVRDLGPTDRWFVPDGYPQSLALCVIDAVFSINAKFQGVINVLNRYRGARRAQGGDADIDGIAELIGTFDHVESPDEWADSVKNHQRTSPRSGILKSDAVLREAHVLAKHGIWTISDLHDAALGGRLANLETDWMSVPGQVVSWGYFLILARPQRGGADRDEGSLPSEPRPTPDLLTRYADAVVGVKPDRMIIAYVAAALGLSDDPPTRRRAAALVPKKAAVLVREAARAKGWDVFTLDHTIWRFQSGRPHARP
jgi:hypothetical protein